MNEKAETTNNGSLTARVLIIKSKNSQATPSNF